MFANGMPPLSDGLRAHSVFCSVSHPGCRQMIIVADLEKAKTARKVVVAGQVWKLCDDRWYCDRCILAR